MLKKLINLTIIFTFFVGLFAFTNASYAADASTGLTISPPINELNANPGDSYTGKIKVTNNSTITSTVEVAAKDFGATDESGAPTVLEDTQKSSYSLKSWVTLKEVKVNIEPKQYYEFNYTLDIPKTAEPGGHYGMILFTPSVATTAQTAGSSVSVGVQVGSMVLVNVSGDSITAGSIKQFMTDKKFYSYKPVEFTTRIENSGNVHFKPSGNLIVKNAFGKQVANLTFNDANGNILPSQIRKFMNEWSIGKRFGWYKANLDLTYASSNKLQSSTLFFIIPWKETTASIILLIVLIWIIRHIEWKKKE
jgi:hypothetical protein